MSDFLDTESSAADEILRDLVRCADRLIKVTEVPHSMGDAINARHNLREAINAVIKEYGIV